MSAPQLPPTPYPPPSAAVRAGSFVVRLLWTLIPFGTVGLLGWVPALHVALRRRTAAAWWWLVGLVAGTVGECTLVSVVPSNSHGTSDTGAGSFGAGSFCVAYLITATVYAWRGCGPEQPAPRPMVYPGYGTGWSPTLPYAVNPAVAVAPGAGAGPLYAAAPGTGAAPLYAATPPTPASAFQPVAQVPAAAAHELAAEVQAELRELRGYLGGEDGR